MESNVTNLRMFRKRRSLQEVENVGIENSEYNFSSGRGVFLNEQCQAIILNIAKVKWENY